MTLLDVMALGAAIFAFVACISILGHEAMKGREASRELAWYKRTYLRRQGGTVGYGNYHLASIDGGQHWFNVERTTEGSGLVVTGPADPELIKHLDGWDALSKYVWRHGPLDLAHSDHVQLLANAGFTVQRRNGS